MLIAKELKSHAPFTLFGAATGVLAMWLVVATKVPDETSHVVFAVLHPLHVIVGRDGGMRGGGSCPTLFLLLHQDQHLARDLLNDTF